MEAVGVAGAAEASGSSVDPKFWSGRRVFLTGHTGFKGAWLGLWLSELGAEVSGYALAPPTTPSLFELCGVAERMRSLHGDVRELESLRQAMAEAAPEVVVHMAAQPLVRESYRSPVDTYAVNLMGTVNLLEAVRACPGVRAVVVVTTDKCYENREWAWGYREIDPLGGFDPYSSSKGCAELAAAAYRNSFFPGTGHDRHGVALATARAGNVIGGGDWAAERLVPDCLAALLQGRPIVLRNPAAIRPWQHVLEPLAGYLLLAQRLYRDGPSCAAAWNFGPEESDAQPVAWIAEQLCRRWGGMASWQTEPGDQPHEAYYLKLDSSKAKSLLGWRPRWDLPRALDAVLEWTRAYAAGGDLRAVCLEQIDRYSSPPPRGPGESGAAEPAADRGARDVE